MAENMYCDGNKVLSEEGRKRWDEIFGKKKEKCGDDCDCSKDKCSKSDKK